jgi:trehalose 6-phosphate synthase/phosphatase
MLRPELAWPAGDRLRARPASPRTGTTGLLANVERPRAERAGRVLIVSNRLPMTVCVDGDAVSLTPSSGGLATGLLGVHARSAGLWIGWSGAPSSLPGATRDAIARQLAAAGAVGVPLAEPEIAGFYERYANGVLWPALHDRTDVRDARPGDWATYRAVNARFADVVARHLRPGDQVWIHDYHLMLVPRLLRARCPQARIGFFLHTPFPDLAALASVPEHAALLDGLLGADVVGLHTSAYVARFHAAVRAVLGPRAHGTTVADGERAVHVHACAMSIDAAAFGARATDPRVTTAAAALRAAGGPLLVGVDRLDYTKGIPERLRGFARLLERVPALRGRARLLQVAVPSREEVPAYRALRAEVEALVARINGRFGDARWTPVDYRYGSVDPIALSALYRAADVMLVTPLRDGMNLVAKEFVAGRPDEDGVLVLSEHAGAAAELRAALLVDPRDVEGLATAYEAALELSPAERRVRMRRLRRCVQRHDVFQWARECLLALGGEHAAMVSRTAG